MNRRRLLGIFSALPLAPFVRPSPPASSAMPSYTSGYAFVPTDGAAFLHQGESVVPASKTPKSIGEFTVTVKLDSSDFRLNLEQLRKDIYENRDGIAGTLARIAK